MTISAISSIAPLPVVTPVEARALSTPPPATAAESKTPKLPIYATPVYKFDAVANIPIEVFRDPSTGTVLNQIPSEQIVQKYRLHQLPTPGTTEASKGAVGAYAAASGSKGLSGGVTGAGKSAATVTAGGVASPMSLVV